MQANRGRDTKPELAVRRALHSRGHRYRVDARPEPGLNRRADLVFTRRKVAVFIDGCYWHGCPEHYSAPATNDGFWSAKIAANRLRDAETTQLLEAAGWQVVRVWEHEQVADAVAAVEEAIRQRSTAEGGPAASRSTDGIE